MENTLLEQFIAEYDPTPQDPATAPDPALNDLIDIEDEISAAVAGLDMVELEAKQRDQLRGQRIADAADLMFEVAEGLRDCKEIADAIKTAPEAFEQVAQQDLAVGGLIQSMQVLHGAADNGQLLRVSEADRTFGELEQKVQAALHDMTIPEERRQAMTSHFTPPFDLIKQARQRGSEATAARDKAAAPEQARLNSANSAEDRAAMVRELVTDALAAPPKTPPKHAPKKSPPATALAGQGQKKLNQ